MIVYKFSMNKNDELTCCKSDNTIEIYKGEKAINKLEHIKDFSFYDFNSSRKKIDTNKYLFNMAFVSNNHVVTFEDISKFQKKASFSIEDVLRELLEIIKENNEKNKLLEENIKRQYNIDVRKTKATLLTAFSAAVIAINAAPINKTNPDNEASFRSSTKDITLEEVVDDDIKEIIDDSPLEVDYELLSYKENNLIKPSFTDKTVEIKEYDTYTLEINKDNVATFNTDEEWDGTVLNSALGVVENGPSGEYETYYDADVISPAGMDNVVGYMRDMGFDEENYPYYIREDGVRMLGEYVMVAADLDTLPRGTIIETTLGTAIVSDACANAQENNRQVDIAVNWTKKLSLKK